jgi:Lrp/AsnC family transcriptional regulator for asnA, asnC and gidA
LQKIIISAGTVHVRVKMEDAGIIMGSSLVLDYDKLGYSFIAYVGVFLIILLKQIWNALMKFHL